MARRRDPIVTLVAVGFLAVIATCCGGPCALIGLSPSQPPATIQPLAQVQPPVREGNPSIVPMVPPAPPARASDNRVSPPPIVPAPTPRWAPGPIVEDPIEEPIAPQMREWVSSGGAHRRSAKFVGLLDGQVQISMADGRTAPVALDKISITDREYVKQLIRVDSAANVIIGKVVGVTDGDTITVLDEETEQHKIRLEGIDAPESGQAFGSVAKQVLSSKVFGKFPWIEWREKDKYGRTLGHIYLDGRHINLEMVAEGFAWHYKEYSSDPRLANAELVARQRKLGLWSDPRAIPPWDFRHNPAKAANSAATSQLPFKQAEQSFTPSPDQEVTVYVTQSGAKYHTAGCRHLAKSSIPISLSVARQRYSPCSVCNAPP